MMHGLFGNATEVDVKGLHSIPYRSISHFSVETAGTFDMDAEMKIYIAGNPAPIGREFKRGADIVGVQKTLAQFILR